MGDEGLFRSMFRISGRNQRQRVSLSLSLSLSRSHASPNRRTFIWTRFWPSYHDAEITEVFLRRGVGDAGRGVREEALRLLHNSPGQIVGHSFTSFRASSHVTPVLRTSKATPNKRSEVARLPWQRIFDPNIAIHIPLSLPSPLSPAPPPSAKERKYQRLTGDQP